MKNVKYRPEIDGLRTIAVLSVIIYHAEFIFASGHLLEGGFLGVDVFFVISGFLITTLIIDEYAKSGHFSILNFYERRVRRLFPALIVVMVSSIPFAWEFLLPEQLIDFSKSLIASLLFVSNIYWDQSLQQYGAESALLKPFLHTWSLAIEEQFYILYPLILVAIYRWCKNYTVIILSAGLLLSFAFAVWMTDKDSSFSFYMLPSRFWELLAGGLLANIMRTRPKWNNNILEKTMPATGLLLIMLSVVFIKFGSNHPGFATLASVTGTILIIWFASKQNMVIKFLSSKLIVGIGLISYALYLWHYPIFAFGRIINSNPSASDKVGWIVLTFILSIASYFLVEKPFRNRSYVSKTALVTTMLAFSVCVGSISFYLINGHGFSNRLPPIIRNIDTDIVKSRLCKKNTICTFNKNADKDIFLVGDSHMMTLEKPLYNFSKKFDFRLTTLNGIGCLYILDMHRVNTKTGKKMCTIETQNKRQKILLSSKKSIVIIGGRLPLMLSEERFNNQEGGDEGSMNDIMQYFDNSLNDSISRKNAIKKEYKRTVLELARHGHKVILVYPVPEVGWNVPKKISLLLKGKNLSEIESILSNNQVSTSYDIYKKRTRGSFGLLDDIQHRNIFRVYPHKIFCDRSSSGRCITHDLKNLFYRDSHHLSNRGATLIVENMEDILNKISTGHKK